MKKSIIALLLALVFVFSLASCASDGGNPSSTPSNEPTSPASTEPSNEPTNEPSNAATIADFFDEVTADKELPMMMDLDDETLKDFYGIDPELLDEYIAKIPMMNVHATEFFIAKVKDGQMDAVLEAINNRLDSLDATWSQYLPDQYELVQNHRLEQEGNYVLFVVSEYAEDIANAFSTTFGK